MTTQNTPGPRTLWSTPYIAHDRPHRWIHVKTTAKRVAAAYNGTTSRPDYFTRTGELPDGAVGSKLSAAGGKVVLFEDRATCLRYMADCARKEAHALEFRAAGKRADADRWDAEAGEAS